MGINWLTHPSECWSISKATSPKEMHLPPHTGPLKTVLSSFASSSQFLNHTMLRNQILLHEKFYPPVLHGSFLFLEHLYHCCLQLIINRMIQTSFLLVWWVIGCLFVNQWIIIDFWISIIIVLNMRMIPYIRFFLRHVFSANWSLKQYMKIILRS